MGLFGGEGWRGLLPLRSFCCAGVQTRATALVASAGHGSSVYFLCFHSDEEELRKSFSELGDSLCDSSASRKPASSREEPPPAGAEPSGAPLYKNGFLVRKVHADSDGKRSTELLLPDWSEGVSSPPTLVSVLADVTAAFTATLRR